MIKKIKKCNIFTKIELLRLNKKLNKLNNLLKILEREWVILNFLPLKCYKIIRKAHKQVLRRKLLLNLMLLYRLKTLKIIGIKLMYLIKFQKHKVKKHLKPHKMLIVYPIASILLLLILIHINPVKMILNSVKL